MTSKETGRDMLEMKGISKSFFGVRVLDKVNLTVGQGEVHALLGENGAGKSTLMNILGGVYTRDAGQVIFLGKPLENTTVRLAEDAGIAFVHQELNLFNDLRVYENIFLRKEIVHPFGVLAKKEMIARTQELMAQLGVDIPATAMVSELETSKKQMLEIAKALYAKAELFILDEPTTSLNTAEIEMLFGLIRRLRDHGKSFIFISHKLQEVFHIADRYTVLRNGKMVQTGDIAQVTTTDIARMMVGQQYTDQSVYQPRELGEVVLKAERLSGQGFHQVSFSVRRGEIVGFTGLKGAGISEMFSTIFGALPIYSGKLTLFDEEITSNTVRGAMRRRLAMIASNRKENSIIPDFSLLENFYISEHRLSENEPIIIKNMELKRYRTHRDALSIKANTPYDMITSLSGGNQQKVILARWLNTKSDILLLDNPTQGIDVGSKAEIYILIQQLALEGKTILVNTLEIPEIMKVADRCVVFFHGRVHTILDREQITEERVMIAATNAAQTEVNA
ncbi:MAG: sugar ABC transporter ATP-binding protein [Christensenellales bacterium]